MIFALLTFLAAFAVAGVAGWFSIVGIMAIYAGAPFHAALVMGIVLEFAKLVTVSWVYRNWESAAWKLKIPMSYFIVALMMATSMGVFGFLTKSHLEQGAATIDNTAKVERLDQQIAREKSVIADDEKVIAQLDSAINSYIGKDKTDKAVSIRKSQTPQRKQLRDDIDASQKRIDGFSEDKLKLTSEVRALQLEVGPIKYIAELFYSSDTNDTTKIETAVKMFTLLIVSTLDPLAVILLIAANHTLLRLQNEKEEKTEAATREYLFDDGGLDSENARINSQESEIDEISSTTDGTGMDVVGVASSSTYIAELPEVDEKVFEENYKQINTYINEEKEKTEELQASAVLIPDQHSPVIEFFSESCTDPQENEIQIEEATIAEEPQRESSEQMVQIPLFETTLSEVDGEIYEEDSKYTELEDEEKVDIVYKVPESSILGEDWTDSTVYEETILPVSPNLSNGFPEDTAVQEKIQVNEEEKVDTNNTDVIEELLGIDTDEPRSAMQETILPIPYVDTDKNEQPELSSEVLLNEEETPVATYHWPPAIQAAPLIIRTPGVSRISHKEEPDNTVVVAATVEEEIPLPEKEIEQPWAHQYGVLRELMGSQPHFIPQKINEETKTITPHEVLAITEPDGSNTQSAASIIQTAAKTTLQETGKEKVLASNTDEDTVLDDPARPTKTNKYPVRLSWLKEFRGI